MFMRKHTQDRKACMNGIDFLLVSLHSCIVAAKSPVRCVTDALFPISNGMVPGSNCYSPGRRLRDSNGIFGRAYVLAI